MTDAKIDISSDAVERFNRAAKLCAPDDSGMEAASDGDYVRYSDYRALRAALDEAERDARRWRHARKFLAIDDIEQWSKEEWFGHVPDELESGKADATIDASREASK